MSPMESILAHDSVYFPPVMRLTVRLSDPERSAFQPAQRQRVSLRIATRLCPSSRLKLLLWTMDRQRHGRTLDIRT